MESVLFRANISRFRQKIIRTARSIVNGDSHSKNNNAELILAIMSGLLWVIGLSSILLSNGTPVLTKVIFGLSVVFGGYYTIVEATKSISQGRLEIDFLMIFAAIGAMLLDKWGDASLLLFLFSLGHALEHYAMNRARKSITKLSELMSDLALVKKNGKILEVHVDELLVGDRILVKPNSKIPADGVVVGGTSAVDQSPITGESIPVVKIEFKGSADKMDVAMGSDDYRVFAGTINGSGLLEINVRKRAVDSTLSRLIQLVKEAEAQKSPTQHLADNFERYYVPTVFVLVVILIFAFLILDETFQQSFYRAMAVLIAASPCALAISTPSAVLAGIARAARQGVLFKGGKPLEDLSEVTAIAFDKTGTLTEGRPKLTFVIPYEHQSEETLLKAAVAVESMSDHPLAMAIVQGAKERLGNVDIPQAHDLEALVARGVRASWQGKKVHIGNRRLFEELTTEGLPEEIEKEMYEMEANGNTAMIVHMGDEYLGLVGVRDVERKEAILTIEKLKRIGIRKTVMLTGDNQLVADAVGKRIGIADPKGNLLPEHKVREISVLNQQGWKVAMVGDGVNDAPAMAKSTIGIAMGAAGSDVALETADIALMADKLENLPFAIELSRKAKMIIRQNLIISLGMVLILVPLTLTGIAAIGPAVIGHEGSTLIVVLNALRLLRFRKTA